MTTQIIHGPARAGPWCFSVVLLRGVSASAVAHFGVANERASQSHTSQPPKPSKCDSLAARLTKASESGHVKRSFTSPPVASACHARVRRCGGSLWCGQRESEPKPHLSARKTIQMRFTRGEADESERKRAREAQLHQPASRERLSDVALKNRSRDAGSTPLPSAEPQRSLAPQISVESIRRCRDRGTS